jgi:hypothetical protein
MFRATWCSSSGESIVSIQHLLCVTLCRWTSSMQVGNFFPDLHTTRSEWHIPDVVLIQLILLMMSTGLLCVGDRLLCRSESSLPTCTLDGQNDAYQMFYWYNWFSWWWARGCSKHVEKWNKCIIIVRQVGYLQDLYNMKSIEPTITSVKHKNVSVYKYIYINIYIYIYSGRGM